MIVTTKYSKKVVIEQDEIEKAIKNINKDKAIGIDNITLKPLSKKNSLKMQNEGLTFLEYNEINTKNKFSKK